MDNESVRKIDKKLSDIERNKKKNCAPPPGETNTGWENFSYGAGKGDKLRDTEWQTSPIIKDKMDKICGKGKYAKKKTDD